MPIKYSIFERARRVIFGSIPKAENDDIDMAGKCGKCEIMKMFVSMLKKEQSNVIKQAIQPLESPEQQEQIARRRYQ